MGRNHVIMVGLELIDVDHSPGDSALAESRCENAEISVHSATRRRLAGREGGGP
jgi:hypothetical protein